VGDKFKHIRYEESSIGNTVLYEHENNRTEKMFLRCSFFSSGFSYVHFPISDSSSPFPFRSVPAQFMTSHELQNKKQRSSSLVSLVLLDLLPETSVLLNADLLGGVELVEAAEVHVLGQQGDHVLVEGLPVRVLEVVPVEIGVRFCESRRGGKIIIGTHFWLPSFS
jgi:hypothetical protein